MIFKILSLIAAYIFWIATQKILAMDTVNPTTIVDRMHQLFDPVNTYLRTNQDIMRYNFILSSLLIDINLCYISLKFLLGDDVKTMTLLFSGFVLRQICQYINRLPYPKNLIWFNPGFRSLFVTYHVDNDFFFSGHTLIAFVTGFDIISNGDIVSQIYGTVFILYELLIISLTFSHYFMDIYAAVATYFMLNHFYNLANSI